MKYYTNIADTPMKFYKFYSFMLPLRILSTVITAAELIRASQGTPNQLLLTTHGFVLFILCAMLLIAIAGILKRKYWGYIFNQLALIFDLIIGITFGTIYALNIAYFDMILSIIPLLPIHILTLIYFEKRKYVFSGAPEYIKRNNDAVSDNTAAEVTLCITESNIDNSSSVTREIKKNKITVIVLSSIAFIWFCSAITMGCLYYINKTTSESKIAELSEKVDVFSDNIKNLQNQVNESIKQISEKNDEIADKNKRISQLEGLLNIANSRNARSNNTFSSSNTGNYSNQTQTCTFPNCNNSAIGKPYCFIHSCMSPGCYNARISTVCIYCKEHKCKKTNCNSQAYQNGYCMLHSR